MELVSLDTFPATYIRNTDLQPEFYDEGILMSFAIDAAERLHSDKTCEHVVSLIKASNYGAPKPTGFKKIVEVAFKLEGSRSKRPMYRDEVISWTGKNFSDCDVKITVECDKCHKHQCSCGDDSVVIKVDEDWLVANSERHYWNMPGYIGARGLNKAGGIGCFHHPEFSLMRPAQHKFFGADYHVKGCVNLDKRLLGDWPVEYKLENKRIRINVEEGTILMAYLAIPKDERGFPLVPNDINVFDAIFWDVEAKMLYRNKGKAKDNFQFSQIAQANADRYTRKALDKLDNMEPLEWRAMMQKYQKNIPYRNAQEQAGRLQGDRFGGAIRRNS